MLIASLCALVGTVVYGVGQVAIARNGPRWSHEQHARETATHIRKARP